MTSESLELEDERATELSSIAAIFPEIVLDPQDLFLASIDLSVAPSDPLPVVFSEPGDTSTPAEQAIEIHYLSHLPNLHLEIALPEGYPTSCAPNFTISTSPQWLSDEILNRLEADGRRIWEELGHGQVVFAYIDHLQQAAENALSVLGEGKYLQMSPDHKISLLDYDIKAKHAAFERETFHCGVCLDPKKGTVCHRMLDCGHVFCRQCLQDFYNAAITEGDITSVRCLAPDCAKNRNADRKVSGKKGKTKTNINPSELLKIPLELDIVKRYVKLKRKAELESDKDTIYCPRTWCQGAARSRKHRKPLQPMENMEISDEESDQERAQEPAKRVDNPRRELLSICEDCSFAFCSRCYQGWHGEFTVCSPRVNTGELTEEDKASMEYLKLHTTPCPTCAAPAQKTHGCNHMICSRCNTHFCYLCSSWLQPENPYQHYNSETTSCYNRLWELEAGDGDDVGIGFAGGVQAREQVIRPVELVDIPEERNALDENGNIGLEEPVAPPPVAPLVGPFAREGPLVLRIGQLPPRPVPRPAPQPAPQPPAAQRNRRQPRQAGRRREPAARLPTLQVDEGIQPAPVQLARRANRHVPRPLAPQHGARAIAAGVANRAGLENGDPQEAAHRAWVMNFVQMALNDEEDLVEWDSDDEEDHGAWAIPVR